MKPFIIKMILKNNLKIRRCIKGGGSVDSDNESNDSDNNDSESSDEHDIWSDIDSTDSNASCICNEVYVRLKISVQILIAEKLDITLTKLVKQGISVEEWKSILLKYVLV